jgi:hypothetical protein
MSAVIKANRPVLSAAFPLVGFTVRTSDKPYFEIAVASDPKLFDANARAARNASNFFSTRGMGPLPAARGEAVFLLPQDAARRFAGHDRLYYTVATIADKSGTPGEIPSIPTDAVPYISISKSFTGRASRQVLGIPNPRGGLTGDGHGYANGKRGSLEWAGDVTRPGVQSVAAPQAPAGRASEPVPNVPPSASEPSAAALEFDYNDGLDPSLWTRERAGSADLGAYTPESDRSVRYAASADAQIVDINWDDVELVPQPSSMSCWATAAAMVIGWRDRVSINPAEIARGAGRWKEFDTDSGLQRKDCATLGRSWGLFVEPPQSYGVAAFRDLIETMGPLWVGVLVSPEPPSPPFGHAVVVTGIRTDGNSDGSGTFLRIKDPLKRIPPAPGKKPTYDLSANTGSEYVLSWQEFLDEYESAVSTDGLTVNVQILHAGGAGDRRPTATTMAFSYSRAFAAGPIPYATGLALTAMPPANVELMRAEFVANGTGGSPKKDCITITNAGVRKLFGSRLQNADGTSKALGSTCQDTMRALQGYGLAAAEQVFEFNDAAGAMTKGARRPDHLVSSIESWLVSQADATANNMSALYVFGLSIMDGYHSVILVLDYAGIGEPLTRVYWADQIYGGWDDVTGQLDARITSRTQGWWDPLPAGKKAKTRATVWPLTM